MQNVQLYWRPIVNAFDPRGPHLPGDIERIYVDRTGVGNPRIQLERQLRERGGLQVHYKGIFSGHPGCGKSTELMYLGRSLDDTFFVVHFDVEHFLVSASTRPIDVLVSMMAAIQDAGADCRQETSAFESFERAQELLEDGNDAVLTGLTHEINVASDRTGKPVLVLVDGLDHVPVSHARGFFESPILTQPPCSLLYTAPIEVYHRRDVDRSSFDAYSLLPLPPTALPTETNDPTSQSQGYGRDEEGIRFLRLVVARRLAALDLEAETVIDSEALDFLVEMSGGVIWSLLRSMREAATFAQLLELPQINLDVAQRVIGQKRQEESPRLRVYHLQALRGIRDHGMLGTGSSDEEGEDDLLRGNQLLSYLHADGTPWFRVAPYLLPELQQSRALA